MKAIRKGDYDVDRSPASEVLNWFSDENAKKEGQYQFAALTIKSVWQSDCLEMRAQQVTIRILERMSCRPGGVVMIQGLYAHIDGIFGLDVGGFNLQVQQMSRFHHATNLIS